MSFHNFDAREKVEEMTLAIDIFGSQTRYRMDEDVECCFCSLGSKKNPKRQKTKQKAFQQKLDSAQICGKYLVTISMQIENVKSF